MEPFLPLSMFVGDPEDDDDDGEAFSTKESCRFFAMLLVLESLLVD